MSAPVDLRRAVFAAYSECLTATDLLPTEISDRLIAAAAAAPAPATPAATTQEIRVVAASVDTAHYDAGRQQGRAEALAIIMELDPEGGIDAYTGWSTPVGPEDEGSAYWDADKLRELFATDGALADMMDKAEGEYWRYQGLQDEAERAHNFAANMHSSGKVREVLAKAGEFDLMGQLCASAPQQHAQAAIEIAAQALLDDSEESDMTGEITVTRASLAELRAALGMDAPAESLVQQHAQAALSDERESQTVAQLRKSLAGWQEECKVLRDDRDSLRQRLDLQALHQRNDIWYWQGDGSDYPESISNSMAVVIRGDQLRAILAASHQPAAAPAQAALPPIPLDKVEDVYKTGYHSVQIVMNNLDSVTAYIESAKAAIAKGGAA